MLPGNTLSPTPRAAPFVETQNDIDTPLVDVEMGGAGIGDTSGGLRAKLWTAYMDGNNVMLRADDVAPVALFERSGITLLSLAFDANMRPFIAFTDATGSHFWWYDPETSEVEIADLPDGSVYPRCSLDDKRPLESANADIILAYMRDGSLYHRLQRDRYATEYLLADNVSGTLVSVGFNEQNCFQFAIAP